MINTILFDLDGTLLTMETMDFVTRYYSLIAKHFKEFDNLEQFLEDFQQVYYIIRDSDEELNNEAAFTEFIKGKYPEKHQEITEMLYDFYQTTFIEVSEGFENLEESSEIVKVLKGKGYQLILATNPVFPRIATENRMKWANLNHEDFDYITTIENSKSCKPSLSYYRNILTEINKTPDECLMVGNDVIEDLVVSKLGIKTYLVEDNILVHPDVEYSSDYQGTMADLLKFVKELPDLN